MATTKNQVSCYLDDHLLTSLDRLSKSLGKSRASTITWILSEFEDGMDQISDCMERVEEDKKAPVSEFLNIISQATYLVDDRHIPLLVPPDS